MACLNYKQMVSELYALMEFERGGALDIVESAINKVSLFIAALEGVERSLFLVAHEFIRRYKNVGLRMGAGGLLKLNRINVYYNHDDVLQKVKVRRRHARKLLQTINQHTNVWQELKSDVPTLQKMGCLAIKKVLLNEQNDEERTAVGMFSKHCAKSLNAAAQLQNNLGPLYLNPIETAVSFFQFIV